MTDNRLKLLKNHFFILQEHGIFQKEIANWIKYKKAISGFSQSSISRLRADSSLNTSHIELLAYLDEMIEELREKDLYCDNSLELSSAKKKEIRQSILRNSSKNLSVKRNESVRAQWKNMELIGPWEITQNDDLISGEGVERYLLSSQSYGKGDFTIFAKVSFDFISPPYLFNAGFILGWKESAKGKIYYNLLLFSDLIVLEAVGFRQGDSFRDFKHLSEYVPFEIQRNHFYDIVIKVHRDQIDLFLDNMLVFSTDRPKEMYGKVGIRPWRSKMILQNYYVEES